MLLLTRHVAMIVDRFIFGALPLPVPPAGPFREVGRQE
jgi:hypothetical protein